MVKRQRKIKKIANQAAKQNTGKKRNHSEICNKARKSYINVSPKSKMQKCNDIVMSSNDSLDESSLEEPNKDELCS